MLPLRCQSTDFAQASMDQVFAHIDDHTRLSSHMGEPSWRTGGGRLETQIDEGRGQKVGSRIRLSGCVFGLELSVEEIVVERDPPRRKVWKTTGAPRLLVIGHYRMGFELSAYESGSLLGVFIEYALPARAGSLARTPVRPVLREMVHPADGQRHSQALRDLARSTTFELITLEN